jgi:hypothetical protein
LLVAAAIVYRSHKHATSVTQTLVFRFLASVTYTPQLLSKTPFVKMAAVEGMGWVARFAQKKPELVSPTGWQLVVRALGTEMIEGLQTFLTDPDLAKAHHAHMRCFRAVIVNFLESCCVNLSYMKTYRSWLCFSYATRALNLHIQPAPESAVCMFSGKNATVTVEFSYIARDQLSGAEFITRSPPQAHLFCEENFITVIQCWMAVGHAETFLREMIAETLQPALSGASSSSNTTTNSDTKKTNKAEAYKLLDSIMTTNEDLRNSISMANYAAYILHQINSISRVTSSL